ncbi:MAG: transmembrane anchor protein [Hyphomicrobiales bacterium]
MFNAEKPSLEELPSSAQLLRSTVIAAVCAVAILVTVVLPAEYGIDPTGAGRLLGLTQMGEIKNELAEEAENDDHSSNSGHGVETDYFANIASTFVGAAHAQSTDEWKDVIEFSLEPGDTYEVKLMMNEGDVAEYLMLVEGGRVNFDLHAHGKGKSKTYEKGRGSTGSEGELVAAFNGNHGWFWRNRDSKASKVTLQVRGTYSELKKGK